MRREGSDPENLSPSDFLCDFCGREWSEQRPMVEGHQGALICGACLKVAYAEVLLHKVGDEPRPLGEGATREKCVMCLEEGRDELHWRSPVDETKLVCRRCIKMGASTLERDKDSAWTKPQRA